MISRSHGRWLACVLALASATTCLARPVPATSDYRKDLVFFVAKGNQDACGKGCSQWIAVEGRMNRGAADRFRDFLLSSPHRRSLPVFFHSIGGSGREGVDIGRILREFGMTAGIGRTILSECSAITLAADSCRNAIRSERRRASAQLRDGFCNSACVFSLVGAVVRNVGPGSYVGIHSPGPTPNGARLTGLKLAEEFRQMKRYMVEMGVDPKLVDAAAKIPYEKMHRLSRGEIAKYGIETRVFETSWFIDKPQQGRIEAIKAWSHPASQADSRFATISLRVRCIRSDQIALTVSRPHYTGDVEIDIGEDVPVLRGVMNLGGHQTSDHYFAWDDMQRALSRGTIKLSVRQSQQGEPWLVAVSTVELSGAMSELRRRCS